MSAIGGSIQSVSIKGRGFSVAGDSDSTRDLGGFTSERAMNGNGTGRNLLTRKQWMVSGLNIEIDDIRGDQEFLQDVQDSLGDVAIGVTYVNGETYSGTGSVSGDFAASSSTATAPIELSGAGKLVRQ